jgi:predicted nucleic acid-binding protein
VNRVLRALPTVNLSDSIAKRAGIIEGELQAKDESDEGIGLVDALIASIALEYDEPIVTGDPDDFRRVEGVRVETY